MLARAETNTVRKNPAIGKKTTQRAACRPRPRCFCAKSTFVDSFFVSHVPQKLSVSLRSVPQVGQSVIGHSRTNSQSHSASFPVISTLYRREGLSHLLRKAARSFAISGSIIQSPEWETHLASAASTKIL